MRLKYICPRGSIAAFAFGSRLSFFLCQEKRDGLRCLAFLFRGSRSPSCVFAVSVRLSAFVSSLRVCAFLYGNLDGLPGCGGRGYGVGGAAFVRFCASTLALLCFPSGVRWGYAPQTCAKESSTLWTLFTLRRGWVGAYTRRRPGTRKDPPEPNLGPGRSCHVTRQPVGAGTACRISSIEDLTGSNLWPGRSC